MYERKYITSKRIPFKCSVTMDICTVKMYCLFCDAYKVYSSKMCKHCELLI